MEPHRKWKSPLSLRALGWLGVNVAAVVLHVLLSEQLWTPPEARGGTYYGGPGDGLYFFYYLVRPALAFGVVNLIALVMVVRSTLRRRSFWPGLAFVFVSALWIGAMLFEHHMMTQGVRLGS